MYLPIIQRQVYLAFGWFLGDKNNPPWKMTSRDENILNHYAKQVDLKRMDTISALDRCIGDIKGRNYHPNKTQR